MAGGGRGGTTSIFNTGFCTNKLLGLLERQSQLPNFALCQNPQGGPRIHEKKSYLSSSPHG